MCVQWQAVHGAGCEHTVSVCVPTGECVMSLFVGWTLETGRTIALSPSGYPIQQPLIWDMNLQITLMYNTGKKKGFFLLHVNLIYPSGAYCVLDTFVSLRNKIVVWLSFLIFLPVCFLYNCYFISLRGKTVYLYLIGLAYLTMVIKLFKIMRGWKPVYFIQTPLQ